MYHHGPARSSGARDPQDASFAATALRETHEELGVDPGLLDVIGLLDDEPTSSGFVITPVVATLPRRPVYRPSPAEVAQVLEVPLTVFAPGVAMADPAQAARGALPDPADRGALYRHEQHRITGATARILRLLGELAWRP